MGRNVANGFNIQIGDENFYHDSGYLRTNPDGSQWLGSGTLALASAYPQAAKYEHMQAVGQLRSNSIISKATDIATDGNQKWVIAYGDATNVYVSVDDGVTWALVAHNAGGPVCSVTFSQALSMWICAGNSAAAFFVATQTQAAVATAWTARAGTAITTGTANSACVRASANEVVMVCAGATTGAASRSTNGTSYAAVNFPQALVIGGTAICRLAVNGANFVACSTGATSKINYSINGGAAFSSSTWSSSALLEPIYLGSQWLGYADYSVNGQAIYSSTDSGATWSLVTTLPQYYFASVCSSGGKVYAHAATHYAANMGRHASIGISDDGINFKFKSLSYIGSNSGTSESFTPRLAVSGATVISTTNSGSIYSDNINTPYYIGMPLICRPSIAPATNVNQSVSYTPRLYQCIKTGG